MFRSSHDQVGTTKQIEKYALAVAKKEVGKKAPQITEKVQSKSVDYTVSSIENTKQKVDGLTNATKNIYDHSLAEELSRPLNSLILFIQ